MYVSVCVVSACAITCMWRSEGNSQRVALFFQHVSYRDQAQVIWFGGGMCFYSLSHFTGPHKTVSDISH